MSYTKNRMTRIVLDKIENDKRLREIDRDQWYQLIDLETLPQFAKFVLLNEDQETTNFIDQCFEKSDWFITQFFHSIMISMLKLFMATTSINGLLKRGSMFVFSVQQFSTLIDFDTSYNSIKMESLLDLGAGDGAVTEKMEPFFNKIYATEMSVAMQWRLKQKGYTIFDVNSWDNHVISKDESQEPVYLKYDAISCLNLLDRCDEPFTLLKQIKSSLKPNGLLIVALVLPFRSFVEYNKDNKPKENLLNLKDLKPQKKKDTCSNDVANILNQPIYNGKMLNKINFQINYLVEEIFEPIGFDLQKITRLPYLCEGNMEQSYYYLHDYVFIFKAHY